MKRRHFLGLLGMGASVTAAGAVPALVHGQMAPVSRRADQLIVPGATSPAESSSRLDPEAAGKAAVFLSHSILRYANRMKRQRDAAAKACAVPFATLPHTRYLRVDRCKELPEPQLVMSTLLEQAAELREARELLEMGMNYALQRWMPLRCTQWPTPAEGLEDVPMVRFITPRVTWDVGESLDWHLNNKRAMAAVADAVVAMVHELAVCQAPGLDKGRLAVTPLNLYVKREAFMIEMFTWLHVLGEKVFSTHGADKIDNIGWLQRGEMISQQAALRPLGLDWEAEQRAMIAEQRYIRNLRA